MYSLKRRSAMRQNRLLFSVCLVGLGLIVSVRADELSADEEMLREARIATDGPGLLEFFRQRVIDTSDADRIKALIRQLGDDSFERREQASRQLVAIGGRARPLLRQALHDPDIEIVRRAEACLRKIEQGATSTVIAAAVRVLAQRKPSASAAVLLTYLPFAEDETVAEEVERALSTLAMREGKPEPVLLAALTDKAAVKRAAAGSALGRAQSTSALPAVRKLLEDSEPVVRLKVGLALASAGDKEAIPVLIALLGEAPNLDMGLVEDLLYRLAGDKAPSEDLGSNPAARRKYRDAWQAWWKETGPGLDLAKLEQTTRPQGLTLVLLLDLGRAIDLDASNRPRWQLDGLQFPLDIQMLPGDRVLVAEHNGNRVTERNPKGEILWEKRITGPLAAQRLDNGNTFIATKEQLVEVDKTGKEVWTYTRPGGEAIMKAQKLRNGDIGLITQPNLNLSRYVRLDRTRKEVRSFGVDVRTSGGRIDVLPNGHVIVPEMGNNRVVEHSAEGKVVWEANVDQPIAAVRLPNGHTMVTSMITNRAVEVDRKGKVVWEYKSDTRVTRALRR
jgi:hypothetical protein